MPPTDLTDEPMTAAMVKADDRACPPGYQRCYAFPDALEDAEKTCTPKGRCKVG